MSQKPKRSGKGTGKDSRDPVSDWDTNIESPIVIPFLIPELDVYCESVPEMIAPRSNWRLVGDEGTSDCLMRTCEPNSGEFSDNSTQKVLSVSWTFMPSRLLKA